MIKKVAFFTGFALSSSLAFAVTTVIDFGPNGTTSMIGTINQVGSAGVGTTYTNMVLNTTSGSDSGIRFTSSGGVANSGAGGSFSPAGNVNYTSGNAVVDGWIANEQAAYGDIWQGVGNANQSGGQTLSLTFSGLAANTDYTFKLLSGRANTYAGASATDPGTYGMTYDGVALTGGGTKASGGSASGLNASNYTWTFSTGATPANAVINLSGVWNANAIVIDAIPEPSAALLGGLGLLALFRRRRR